MMTSQFRTLWLTCEVHPRSIFSSSLPFNFLTPLPQRSIPALQSSDFPLSLQSVQVQHFKDSAEKRSQMNGAVSSIMLAIFTPNNKDNEYLITKQLDHRTTQSVKKQKTLRIKFGSSTRKRVKLSFNDFAQPWAFTKTFHLNKFLSFDRKLLNPELSNEI